MPALAARGDWRLGALCGAIFIARSAVRFTHAQRSVLVARDPSSLYALCFRGKAKTAGSRPAFRYSIPTAPLSAVGSGAVGAPQGSGSAASAAAMDILWTNWIRCRASDPALNSIVVDFRTGNALSMATFHNVLRELAVECDACTDAHNLTSKGCRMVQPTLCDIRGADWGERLAVGNWTEAQGSGAPMLGKRSVIPARYQGSREQTAAFAKLFQWRLLTDALGDHASRKGAGVPLDWDGVRAYVQRTPADSVAAIVAESMEGTTLTPAPGCEGLAADARGRRFAVPTLPERKAEGAAAASAAGKTAEPAAEEESSSDSSSDSSSASSASAGVDMSCMFVHRAAATAVVHFEADGMPNVPQCYSGIGKELQMPVVRGQGLRRMLDTGRSICEKCLARASPEVRRLAARLE